MIKFDKKRNFGLDILRAIAIFFVLNVHSALYFRDHFVAYNSLVALNLDGVTLFFVLSGFLIGGILIRLFENNSVSPRLLFDFWKRRWFRTLPTYFLVLTILLLFGHLNNHIPPEAPIKKYYFFLANFKSPLPDYFFPESWSLAVEEWFYILTPIGLYLLTVINFTSFRKVMVITIVSTIILVVAFRYYRLTHSPLMGYDQIDADFRKQVLTRLDSLMVGVSGAYLNFYHYGLWKRHKKLLFGAGVLLLYLPYLQRLVGDFGLTYTSVFSFFVQSIGFLCLFPWLTDLKSGKGIVFTLITLTSTISYSLYLLNYSLVKNYFIGFINKGLYAFMHQDTANIIDYFLFWVITFGGAIVVYRFFEKPVMDIRDKF